MARVGWGMLLALGLLGASLPMAVVRPSPARAANDADAVYDTAEDALAAQRKVVRKEDEGNSATDVISKFFPEPIEDDGTYPASEFLDHNFDLRRTPPDKLKYSGRLFGRYSNDKISGVKKWEKEFELNLAYKDFDGYLRFSDFNVFPNVDDPFRWEKGQLRYKHDRTKVTVGSFSALFGRGLALNMFEERTLQFDNEPVGLKVEEQIGDNGLLTVLRGTRTFPNELGVSSVEGVRLAGPVARKLDLGAHLVKVQTVDKNSAPSLIVKPHLTLIGGDVNWHPGSFRLYGESVLLKRQPTEGGTSPNLEGYDGHGLYLNAGYSRPGFTLDGEYKDYYRLDQEPFLVLPPVRRWVQQASAQPADDIGYGVNLGWNPHTLGGQFNVHYSQDNHHKRFAHYHELLESYTSPTKGRTAWIAEHWEVTNLFEKHKYNRLTVDQKIDRNWNASNLIQQHWQDLGQGFGVNDWMFEPEVAYQSKVNATYTYEFVGGAHAPGARSRWELLELKYKPDGDNELNLALGAREAGFVCSGGVCRQEPEFSGIKLDWLRRF